MGRPIVYCDGCGKLLREEDFARGKAQEIDHRNFCVECRPLPKETPRTPGHPVPASPRKSSSHRTPAARPGSKSSNLAVAPAPPKSNMGLWMCFGGGALLVLAVVVAAASSGAPKPSVEEEIRVRPVARPSGEPVPPAPAADVSREPLLKALAYRRARPNDLGGQVRELEAALRALAGTRHEEDAKKELAAVQRKVRDELAELERQAGPFAAAEEFGKALRLLDASRRRYDHAEWIQGVDPLIARVRVALENAKREIRAKADDARRREAADELARLSTRVRRWELPEEEATLAVHLVLSPPADPPPPPPPPPPAVAPKRVETLAHAAARDYEAALASLGDAKEDVDILRAAQTAAQEGAAALLRAPRGKKIAVEYRDATGAAARIDDLLLRADATRLELKFGESSVVIPVGEVAARSLAEAYRARGGDARGAAALCWLEGDVEGAKGVALPERLKGEGPPADEAARAMFYLAEALFFDRPAESLAAYRTLLADHASTAFVRRNMASIRARLEPPKEIIFLAEEISGAGTFKLVPNRRVERCWTSESDSDSREGNYVEFAFPAAPDNPARLFVYAGGCCAETFTAFLRGSDLKADVDIPLKHTLTGLKRKHGDHLGPKEPDRWEWLTIVLPKYAEAGTKTLRIHTDQKGFSVAMGMVSSERKAPPRDLERKEVERARADIPGYLSRGGLQLGSVTWEIWTGIGGGGVAELKNAPGFPDRPASRQTLKAFETPKDTADDFGSRVLGHLYPPVTGDYVFWIASDDQGELWLSTDDDPKNKALIARVPEWTSPHEYEKHGDQKSKPVRLEAGRRYYIEALQKEGGGGDHVSVRWQLPDGKIEQPIPGARLSPVTPKR